MHTPQSARTLRKVSARALIPLALLLVVVAFVAPRIAASEPDPPSTYVVQPGDTLSAIADRFGTSVDVLVSLNDLTHPGHIVAGTTLRLPSGGAGSGAATETYRVQVGDTLSGIAAAHGLHTSELARLNGISDLDQIRVGTDLRLPSTGANAAGSGNRSHLVAAGETLSSIADDYGTSIPSIREANGLGSSDLIRVGQTLSIPSSTLPQLSTRTASALQDAASESGVDRYLLLALSLMESGWQSQVVSSTGAVGLMQLMPDTAEWTVDNLATDADNWHLSIEDNARVGAAYFAHLLFLEGGDVEGALASYYQGWASYRTNGMFEETRDYVDDVLALVGRLRASGVSG